MMAFVDYKVGEVIRFELVEIAYDALNACTYYKCIGIVEGVIEPANRYLRPEMLKVSGPLLDKFLSMCQKEYAFTYFFGVEDTYG